MGSEGAPKNARARARPDWAPAFLKAFEDTGLVSEAAKVAGVNRRTAWKRREADEEFAQEWAAVVERVVEGLEREAVKRAHDGSDVLLIFLLKAHRPDMYRDNHRVELAGSETPVRAEIVAVDARKRSDAAREYLARLAAD